MATPFLPKGWPQFVSGGCRGGRRTKKPGKRIFAFRAGGWGELSVPVGGLAVGLTTANGMSGALRSREGTPVTARAGAERRQEAHESLRDNQDSTFAAFIRASAGDCVALR